jgi:tRNA pseudouridine38-40 synthase
LGSDLPLNIYKLTLQYKGTRYSGFQIQVTDLTIQGELANALKILSKTDDVRTLGSGRTDAGVHALGQIVRIEIPVNIPAQSLVKAINSHLPHDIRVVHADIADENFHPIYSARSKEYNYVFSTQEMITPFADELVTHFPYDLDIELMRKGCKIFCGEHDFINYQCTGTDVETTVRKILDCEILSFKGEGHFKHILEDYYVLRVVGTGFLKQMVRLMMGALWSLGRGKITLEDLEKSLKTALPQRLGATAPPQGLYLKEVHY